ncbi:hypothetical protein EJ05DRAFT_482037 [Pseudovirgaria hyperparasitica]|uniref:DUF2415 domain-containing protein n=1 Tax=Pseudovirgaria hyperparasitica TaxID=470096 RepID=A0A6A6WMG0_9PEZI|nr:uncharacterized protein EJ05DRAFT_482037 [Pseudovirgaria hyperparasitica]KAF2763209.1 hypothetical protein EJ05DRAFT_482037 [Pseudovirgaria hyperparasitica]
MAVDDFDYHETDSLILPAKTFFPLSIHVAHYQLRHYISSSKQDTIYYADRENVYCLNVHTKRRTLVASLSFDARCTASGYGWICVGGETEGLFAAIQLDGSSHVSGEVDASLPVSLGTGATTSSRRQTKVSPHNIHFDRIGLQIVNSISIHKLLKEGPQGEDEVVAVLTNNDKTVRVYSLPRRAQIARLDCPFPMNHATISPDGHLLVAVGDEQRALFYERRTWTSPVGSTEDLAEDIAPSASAWGLIATVSLHCPPTVKAIGYFTTAWSSSGHLCAVASECGYITVIDTLSLPKCESAEDAIVNVIKSTRPDRGHGPGSVRTMLFSRQPWDLLIWTEDQGRMCVADLRSGLISRQVIHLNSSEDGIERIVIPDSDGDSDEDLTHDGSYLRRHSRALDAEGNAFGPAAFEARRSLGSSITSRPMPGRAIVVESDNDPHGLSPRARRIIDSLPTTTERDTRPEVTITPRSITYTQSGRPVHPSYRGATEYDVELSSSRDVEVRNIGHDLLSLDVGETLRDRYSDSARRYRPHRQSSVVVPETRLYSNASTRNGQSTTGNRMEQSASPGTYSYQPADGALDRAEYPSTVGTWIEYSTTAGGRVRRERPRVYGLRHISTDQTHDGSYGVRTAGLAASEDGRSIYAGAEDGIYVFAINTLARKMFPAVSPRLSLLVGLVLIEHRSRATADTGNASTP